MTDAIESPGKFFLSSKTVQGIIVAALVQVLPFFGLSADADILPSFAGDLVTILGLAWALLGRLKAEKPITFKPVSKTATIAVLLVFLVPVFLFGCAGSGQSSLPGADNSSVEATIGAIQTVEKSLGWIIPIAAGVVAIFFPEAIPAYQMAAASYKALITVTDSAVAAYRGSPTEANAAKLTDMLAQLKNAWSVLDGAYKADPAAIAQLPAAA